MTIEFPYCDFKCDRENGTQLCHNWALTDCKSLKIEPARIAHLYVTSALTSALCMQGLEPMDSFDDVIEVCSLVRAVTDDDIVIYTGYNRDEIEDKIYTFGVCLNEEKYKEVIGEILKYSETKAYLQNLINITNF